MLSVFVNIFYMMNWIWTFKVSITHSLDMPIIQQSAVNLIPGRALIIPPWYLFQVLLFSLVCQPPWWTSQRGRWEGLLLMREDVGLKMRYSWNTWTIKKVIGKKPWLHKSISYFCPFCKWLSCCFRYQMSNCLYEATTQIAYKNCSCYPGKI